MRTKSKAFKRITSFLCVTALLLAGFGEKVKSADAAKKISLNKTKVVMQSGESFKLKVKNASKASITFSSSKEKIAVVNSKGLIKAKKQGNATITVKIEIGGEISKKTCKVIVKKKEVQEEKPFVANDYVPEGYAPSYKSMEENNPLLTNSFACDPTAMVYDGRVYVYMTNDSQQYEKGEHKKDNTYGYINSLHIISSDDLVNWTDHGTFQISGEGGVCSWVNCCWAPSAVHKTVDGKEKFYVYFTNGGWSMGVVEADSPLGPFRDIKGEPLYISGQDNDSKATALDPAVFIDDDGSAYIVYGGTTGGTRLRKLNSDMMSFASDPIDLEAPYFFEASWLNKINGKYYFSYCSDWNKRSGDQADLGLCSIAYMTADSPEGPYTYAGEILPNCGTAFDDVWGNNHHSIINFNGQYYIFYQARTLETAMGIGLGYRSTHINKLTINGDGTIEKVVQDRKGIDQIKNFDPYRETLGTTAWNTGGMNAIHFGKKSKCVEEGAYMETAVSKYYQYSWIGIKKADFGETSPAFFQATMEGKPNTTATLSVRTDSLEGTELAKMTISFDADGKGVLNEVVAPVTGVHDLYLVFDEYVKDFKTWKFVR